MSDFEAKIRQNRLRLGLWPLCPRSRSGSLQQSPDPQAGIKGTISKGKGGVQGREEERGERKGGEERVDSLYQS